MRSWLAAVMLLQLLVAAPAAGQPVPGPPLPGPLPWRSTRAGAGGAPVLRLAAEDGEPQAPLLAAAGRRRLPPVTGRSLDTMDGRGFAEDFARCVSEEERRAAKGSERFKAFRRSAVPLPPLLYLSQDRTFVEALFLYWSSTNVEERTKLRMLLPVFVWSCTPKNRTLVTPLFAHRDDREGRAGFIGPYYYRRDRHAQSDVLFPLFARVVDRDQSTITALSFYYYRNRRGAHGGLVPLAFWGSYRDGSHYALAPPLFFYTSDAAQSTTVVPPFYLRRHRGTPGWDAGLVPLYFGGRHGRRYHHVVLPPLFAHWGDARRARTMVLNLYVRVNKNDPDWMFFLIPAALGFRASRTVAFVSPAVTHVRTPSSSTTIVPPFYLYRDERSVHTALMPLFFHGHRRGHRQGDRQDQRRHPRLGPSSYTHLPPLLFFDVRDRRGATTVALNSYYRRGYLPDGSVDPRDWDAGVIPLWFQGRTRDRRYLYLPPLFFFDRENEATGERTTISPLFYRLRDRRSSSFGVIPFFFASRSGPAHLWIAPLLLAGHSGDLDESTTVVGPWFQRRTPTARHRGFVPLFFQGHTATYRYTVVPILPFWYERQADRRLLVVGPFFHSRSAQGYDVGLVPLVMSGRRGTRRYTAVPPLLLYDWADAAAGTRTTLFPVGYHHRHPGGWDFGLVPLVFASAHGPAHRTSIPPLLTFHWGDGQTEKTVVGGLLYSSRTPGARHHGLVPLYFAGERDAGHPDGPSGYRLVAPPLYVHRWSAASETTLFLQTWAHYRRDGEWHGGSFPFYLGGRVPASRAYYDLVLPPLFVRLGGGNGRYSFLLAGPVYYGRVGEKREFGALWLYAGGRNLGDGSHRYDYVLPPLFMRWEDRHERKLIVGPFYDRVTATSRDTHFLPFYMGGYDRARGSYYDAAFPLFARWGDRDRERTLLLNGYFMRDRQSWDFGLAPLLYFGARRDGGRYAYLFPLFWHRRTPDRSTTVVLPGFYSGGRDGYDVGLAPVFFHGSRTDGRHYAHVPPVFWHWGGTQEEGTVVFPLGYSYRHRDRYSRAVTPLFYQWGDRRVGKSLLFPLAYFERQGPSSLFLSPLVVSHIDAVEDKQRLVVFPLFWRFASRDSQVNVAFPIWWDFHQRRTPSRLTILFPLGFRYDRRDETMTMFLNVAYTRGKGRFASAWSFYFVPLFEVASFNPDHFKWQVLLGLLGRERQGRLSRWRIAYFWTEPS